MTVKVVKKYTPTFNTSTSCTIIDQAANAWQMAGKPGIDICDARKLNELLNTQYVTLEPGLALHPQPVCNCVCTVWSYISWAAPNGLACACIPFPFAAGKGPKPASRNGFGTGCGCDGGPKGFGCICWGCCAMAAIWTDGGEATWFDTAKGSLAMKGLWGTEPYGICCCICL